MQIRNATINDKDSIKHVYLQAFEGSEALLVSECAINLLNENNSSQVISFVAINENEIIGHIAFSPVFANNTEQHFAYILAPLAVVPKFQQNQIGSSLVTHGLDAISHTGSFMVFVYGDPQYYCKFGFQVAYAKNFDPPYTLEHPKGWQALKLNAAEFPESCSITCIDSLNNPKLW